MAGDKMINVGGEDVGSDLRGISRPKGLPGDFT